MIQQISNNIFTIDAFLSEQESENYIIQSEKSGYNSADVDTGAGRSLLTEIRNNERVDWHSPELAQVWWNRLPIEELPTIANKRPIELSPHFRFYKYTLGQKFNMHKDGRQTVNGKSTHMTLLVYLNEGYQGGETKFRQDDMVVSAKIGKALLFEHHLWHQGVKLISGTKYVLRTDVVFD